MVLAISHHFASFGPSVLFRATKIVFQICLKNSVLNILLFLISLITH